VLRILEAGILVQDGVRRATQGNAALAAEFLTRELGHTWAAITPAAIGHGARGRPSTTPSSDNERRFRVQFATGRRFQDAGVVGANTTELVVGGLFSGATCGSASRRSDEGRRATIRTR
jgi:hypothetical protein